MPWPDSEAIMAMDASIILQGQTPDILGAMDRGRQAAENQINLSRQNALAQLYKSQGAGILAGDQGALNALAGMDPSAAMAAQSNLLGMESTRLGMDQTRQQMAVLDENNKRAAEEYARGLSKEQAAAEAAKIEAGVKQALMAPTPEAFDALMVQIGQPDMVGQFENRDMLAGQFMSVAEILKMTEPPALNDRFKVAGGTIFDLGAEGGPKPVGQGAMQETVVMGPDGKPIMVQGGPGTSAKFTEAQSKDNVYVTRAQGALDKLESQTETGTVADDLGSLQDKAVGMLPLVGNYLQSDAYQTAKTAGDEFLQAILRKDTGAAITTGEQSLYGETYLPQPGDGPQRLAYKKEARLRAVEAIKAGMNPQQIEAAARADAAVVAKLPKAGDGGKPQDGPKRLKYNPETGALE